MNLFKEHFIGLKIHFKWLLFIGVVFGVYWPHASEAYWAATYGQNTGYCISPGIPCSQPTMNNCYFMCPPSYTNYVPQPQIPSYQMFPGASMCQAYTHMTGVPMYSPFPQYGHCNMNQFHQTPYSHCSTLGGSQYGCAGILLADGIVNLFSGMGKGLYNTGKGLFSWVSDSISKSKSSKPKTRDEDPNSGPSDYSQRGSRGSSSSSSSSRGLSDSNTTSSQTAVLTAQAVLSNTVDSETEKEVEQSEQDFSKDSASDDVITICGRINKTRDGSYLHVHDKTQPNTRNITVHTLKGNTTNLNDLDEVCLKLKVTQQNAHGGHRGTSTVLGVVSNENTNRTTAGGLNPSVVTDDPFPEKDFDLELGKIADPPENSSPTDTEGTNDCEDCPDKSITTEELVEQMATVPIECNENDYRAFKDSTAYKAITDPQGGEIGDYTKHDGLFKCIKRAHIESYNNQNFVTCSDENSTALIKMKQPLCADDLYTLRITQSFSNTAKCLGLDPLDYFAAINQESRFHPFQYNEDGSTGIGQVLMKAGKEDGTALGFYGDFVQQGNFDRIKKELNSILNNSKKREISKAVCEDIFNHFNLNELKKNIAKPCSLISDKEVSKSGRPKNLDKSFLLSLLSFKRSKELINHHFKKLKTSKDSTLKECFQDRRNEVKNNLKDITLAGYNMGPYPAIKKFCTYLKHKKSGQSFADYLNEKDNPHLKRIKENLEKVERSGKIKCGT